mmetsp:Transcript_21124/g.26000  ORF Transcript_21124/g.26000 Transcript_21124/m.26000 type:complete len:287 (-) Transcript_21124:542-1402(-)
MGGGDEFFFFDTEKNLLNIVAFHRYAKMTDVDEFRNTMLKRACKFPRLKSKVTKFLGKFMLKEQSDAEVMASINRAMPVISDIHNERQLADFMAKEQSYRLPLDELQWRVYFVPDYRPDESLFVYKVHHSLADGIANILFFNDMTDNPTIEGYPNLMVRLSFIQNLLIKLALPFYINYLSFKMLFLLPKERNGFKNDKIIAKLSSHKNVDFVPDIDLNDVKKRANELTTDSVRVTINDVLMTVLSKSIKDYLDEHTSDKDTKFVRMACPFSLRPPPQSLGDYSFDN